MGKKRNGINLNRTGNKTVAVVMAIVFLVSAVPLAVFATSTAEKLKQAQEDQEKTEQEKAETAGEIDAMEETTEILGGKLHNLNVEMTEVSANLERLEDDITAKKAEIEQTEQELAEAIRIRDEQYEAMKLRIKFMYESRDYILLETLLASANFSDFLNRNEYIEKIMDYDKMKLEEFQQIEAEVGEKKELLIAEKEDLDNLLLDVQKEKARVAGLVSQTSGDISHYQDQISQAEQDMLAIEQRLKEQNETVEQLQKQLAEERRLSELAAKAVWRNLSDITFAEGDRYLLANLIYCEAGNQPYTGQVAVGAVVMNRVLSPVFPDTIYGVVYQNRQFAPVASGRLSLALTENRATPACYRAADEAMAGASTVGNCLFFRTPIEGLTGISIGGHIFY